MTTALNSHWWENVEMLWNDKGGNVQTQRKAELDIKQIDKPKCFFNKTDNEIIILVLTTEVARQNILEYLKQQLMHTAAFSKQSEWRKQLICWSEYVFTSPRVARSRIVRVSSDNHGCEKQAWNISGLFFSPHATSEINSMLSLWATRERAGGAVSENCLSEP